MPDLGKKFECYSCRTKFYNLGRPEAVCPKCGANQKNAKDDAPPPPPRPPRRVAVIMEPPPEGNPDEFSENEPAPVEEEERAEDDELAEDEEIVEADRAPAEEEEF